MRKVPPSSTSFEKSDMPTPMAVTRSKRAKTTYIASARNSKRARIEIGKPAKTAAVKALLSCCQCKKKDAEENFIDCKGICSSKIHLSCLQSINRDLAKNAAQSWQCDNCQFCRICKKEVFDGRAFVKCCECNSCFHRTCHGTTVDGKQEENRFRCDACEKTRMSTTTNGIVTTDRVLRRKSVPSQKSVQMLETATNDDSIPSEFDFLGFDALELLAPTTLFNRSKSVEHLAPHSIQKERCLPPDDNRNPIDDGIPDASEWSTNDVYSYFKGLFPRHAYAFAEEEIDGPALYDLRREDILLKFKLKVGPSLRIYQHILKLQKAQQKRKSLPRLSTPTFRKL